VHEYITGALMASSYSEYLADKTSAQVFQLITGPPGGQAGTNGTGNGGSGAAIGSGSTTAFAGGAGGSGTVIVRFPSFF
jgi:hypothetical protein